LVLIWEGLYLVKTASLGDLDLDPFLLGVAKFGEFRVKVDEFSLADSVFYALGLGGSGKAEEFDLPGSEADWVAL